MQAATTIMITTMTTITPNQQVVPDFPQPKRVVRVFPNPDGEAARITSIAHRMPIPVSCVPSPRVIQPFMAGSTKSTRSERHAVPIDIDAVSLDWKRMVTLLVRGAHPAMNGWATPHKKHVERAGRPFPCFSRAEAARPGWGQPGLPISPNEKIANRGSQKLRDPLRHGFVNGFSDD